MKRSEGFALVAMIVLASISTAVAGQLEMAKAGELQCYSPKTTNHRCTALSGYTFSRSGITNNAQVMISANPLIVMSSNTPVTITGETVCGPLHKADIDAASFAVNGQPAAPDIASQIRSQLLQVMASRLDKQVCTTYLPAGNGFTTHVTVDGAADSSGNSPVILVGPADGYTVGP